MEKERKGYLKTVACLESLWDENVDQPLSVLPIIEAAARLKGFRYRYLPCNTREELGYNLGRLSGGSEPGLLYLAFHGRPGQIVTARGDEITLEELAGYMGRDFSGWVVHFSTCGTTRKGEGAVREFIRRTGAAMVLGYDTDVDWTESSALDLLLFDWIQEYRSLKPLWSRFSDRYSEMVELTGLRVFFRRP